MDLKPIQGLLMTHADSGQKVYGELHLPEGHTDNFFDERCPLVIFSHGFGGNHKDCLDIQNALVANGIAVYAFDFRGGSSFGNRSDGEVTDLSVFSEKADLELVLRILKSNAQERRIPIDPERIYLLGESFGGLVSALVANDQPEDVRGLFLLYPAFNIPEMVHMMCPDPDNLPERFNAMGLTLGRVFAETLVDYSAYDHLAGYDGPVQIYHGTEDRLVPMKVAEKAASIYERAELIPMEGEGHIFSDMGEEKAVKGILREILGPYDEPAQETGEV